MRYILLLLFWIPLASFAQIIVDSKGDKLNGHIKKMVDYQYSLFADSNHNRVPDQTAIYAYDEQTKQENVCFYWGSDSARCVYREIFKYNGNKLTQHQHISKRDGHGGFIEGDSISSIITYKYDDGDRLIEIISSQNGIGSKTSYIYEDGNIAETNHYMNAVYFDGSPYRRKSRFKYDNTGHVIQEDIYDNKRTYHITYKYDNNYHYSEEHKIDTTCSREWKMVRQYDDRMNLIEEVCYYKSDDTKGKFQEHGPHIKNEYKYDGNGNWVERTYYLYGKKDSYIKRVIIY